MPNINPFILVEYACYANCGTFGVLHRGDHRNSACCWCGQPVTLTGKITKLEDGVVVVYQDGIEIERRPPARTWNTHTKKWEKTS